MFSFYKNWRERRILRRYRIPESLWNSAIREERCLRHLTVADLERLRDLASLFLYEKSIEPARGFEITAVMKARIGCLAALPILNLGLDYYHPWYSVIVYAEAFVSRDYYQDDAGVVHSHPEARAGEAWARGPVIISWEDVASGRDGYNVVIHEMAHKLDLLDGVANGYPPIHAGMQQQQWTVAFREAYDDFVARIDTGQKVGLDGYAATSPAEFFAVASEAFFTSPRVLWRESPRVYEQLALYYRQQP